MTKPLRRPKSSIPEIDDALYAQKEQARRDASAKIREKGNRVRVQTSRLKSDDYLAAAQVEDDMVAAIDFRADIATMKPLLEKLVSEKFDPTSFFGAISKFAAAELASVAFTGEKEKNRLDALKHLLALGGHNATQKHEISRVDPSTEKEALMSIVRGAQKDLLAEGIEIVDDTEDKFE